jgi:hypothetical protein
MNSPPKQRKAVSRCVHCRRILKKVTKDRVFPTSWYPVNTPAKIQRWTVPSCGECNGRFGALEQDLFIRMAICVGPIKAEAAGLSRKAVESLGVRTSGLSAEEIKHRQMLREKILRETQPYAPGTETFPGLGPHAGFAGEQQYMIKIPEQSLKEVAKKIARGCEYILARGRIVEDPYELGIYFCSQRGH